MAWAYPAIEMQSTIKFNNRAVQNNTKNYIQQNNFSQKKTDKWKFHYFKKSNFLFTLFQKKNSVQIASECENLTTDQTKDPHQITLEH